MPIEINIRGEGARDVLREIRLLATGLLSTPPVYAGSPDTLTTAGGEVTDATQGPAEKDVVVVEAPVRNKRRTKAEIAADEAAKAAVQQATVQPNISTGGERIEPNGIGNGFTDVEDLNAAQDKADEQSEQVEAKVYTLDDVRNAIQPYVKKWTIAVAQQDIGPMITDIGGAPNISSLDPNNQAVLKKLVETFEAAGKADTRYVKPVA